MATRIHPGHLVAAGAALRHVEKLGIEAADVRRVTLDGAELDVGQAAAALAEAEQRPMPTSEGLVARVLDRLERTADGARPRIEGNKLGRLALKVISDDPEKVARTGVVVLELRNGAVLPVPVNVVDATASRWLQRTSALVELVGIPIGLLPFMPNVASGGMAVAAGLASLFADAIGRRDLGGALRATAGKHVAIAVTSVVPGLGELVAAYSLLLDQSNLRRLNAPVTVEDVVRLGAAPSPSPA